MRGSPRNGSVTLQLSLSLLGGARQQHNAAQVGDAHHADLQCLQQYSPCFLKPLCVTSQQFCKLLSMKANLRVFRPLQRSHACDHMGCLETSAIRRKWATVHGHEDHRATQDWALCNCKRSHMGRAGGQLLHAQAAAVHRGLCCAVSASGGSRCLCDCQSCKPEVCIGRSGPLHFQSEATPRECSRLQGLAESNQDA